MRSNLERFVARNIVAKIFTEIVAQIMGGKIDYKIGAHTTLHVLLDKTIDTKSGEFFSQVGVYKNKNDRAGEGLRVWLCIKSLEKLETENILI